VCREIVKRAVTTSPVNSSRRGIDRWASLVADNTAAHRVIIKIGQVYTEKPCKSSILSIETQQEAGNRSDADDERANDWRVVPKRRMIAVVAVAK